MSSSWLASFQLVHLFYASCLKRRLYHVLSCEDDYLITIDVPILLPRRQDLIEISEKGKSVAVQRPFIELLSKRGPSKKDVEFPTR